MNRLFAWLLAAWIFVGPAFADSTINNLGAGAAVQSTDIFPAYQGANPATGPTAAQIKTFVNTGQVSSVTGSCGVTVSPTTGATVASANVTATTNTNTTDTITNAQCGTVREQNSASSSAIAITTAGFVTGNYFTGKNIGAGAATYTPSSGTIGGAATLVCQQGQSFDAFFDGTNFITLSNTCGLGTASTANTGTSGGTLPFLNGTNTWSGTQTFGEVLGSITTQLGTTYTFAATDCGTEVTFSNAGAVTATIPQTLPAGCNIAVAQLGAGKVSVNGSAVTPATLHSAHSYTGTAAQYSIIGINIYSAGTPALAILTGDGA